MLRSSRLLRRRAALLGCAVMLLSGGALLTSAAAEPGPFSSFSGNWSGTGVIRVKGDSKQTTERVRCTASYRRSGSHDVGLRLGCKSDNYKFDLTGNFEADAGNQITGSWSEETHNVGGSVIGQARGDRLLVHAESPAMNANLSMITHSRLQSVALKAAGGGQEVSASITLRRH